MKLQFLIVAAVVALSTICAVGQATPNCAFSENMTADEEKQCREAVKRAGEFVAGTRFLEPSIELLPDVPDSWIVHLVTRGGFTGRGLPTITVNSNREYACGEAQPLIFQTLDDAKFDDLDEAIRAANFRVETGMKKSETPVFACNDCLKTAVALARRDPTQKPKIFLSNSSLSRYGELASRFNLIRSRIEDLGVCRN